MQRRGTKKTRQPDTSPKQTITRLEDLSNELIYETFDYLDYCTIYETFACLNQRFQSLTTQPSLSVKISVPLTSKSTFQRRYETIILPNRERVISLHVSTGCLTWFSLESFSSLRCLSVQQFLAENLPVLLRELCALPHLASLSVDCLTHFEDENSIYRAIFLLRKLTYCKLAYPVGGERVPLPFATNPSSILERLIINGKCRLEQVTAILSHTPSLRYLSCDHLYGSSPDRMQVPPLPVSLTSFRLTLCDAPFDDFQWFLSKIGRRLEKLRMGELSDRPYFQAQLWETLIRQSLPCLSLIDLRSVFPIHDYTSLYVYFVDGFLSSFWTEHGWYFDRYIDGFGNYDLLRFSSRLPYRYEKFTFTDHGDRDESDVSLAGTINFARHLTIEGSLSSCKPKMKFPRVDQLTLQENHAEENPEFINLVSSIVPLTQIVNLHIQGERFPVHQLLKLLNLATNVQSLTLSHCPIVPRNKFKTLRSSFIQNKISKLVIYDDIEDNNERQLRCLFRFFPQLQCLEISGSERMINMICQVLLEKTKEYSPQCLHSIFFFNMEDRTMDQLRRIIDEKQLLNDYTVKCMHAGWQLWW